MNSLLLGAYHHAYRHGAGWTDWIAHTAVSALIHSVIYSAMFRLMHRLTAGEAVLLAVVVVGAVFLWGRSRDRR